MMWSVLFNMLKMIVTMLKYPFYIILILIAIFSFLVSVNVIIGLSKGKRFKKGEHYTVKKESFLKRIFIRFPAQFVDDLFEKDPEFFKYQGMIIFEGRQGMGKTISLVEFMKRMQAEYPKAVCTTNLDYTYEDKALKDWRMLMSYKNGIQGVIVSIDELQNWFSSNDSKNFPPEMLEVITQNRKNRRIILGTSQNFYLLAKAIRSQATEVRRCSTLFRLFNYC
ncbi:MAG: AAA family ATPase [Clostridia bacterium]|nr:AAA family ATPase [Clostridia bacterium]